MSLRVRKRWREQPPDERRSQRASRRVRTSHRGRSPPRRNETAGSFDRPCDTLYYTASYSASLTELVPWWRKHRRSPGHRISDGSGLAGQALKSAAPRRIQAGHLLCKVAERHVSVLSDEVLDLRARPHRKVLLPAQARCVEVGLSLATPRKQALLVKPRHDRHVRRIRALVTGRLVEGVHHRPHRSLPGSPQLLHDLRLELVQRRGNRSRAYRLSPGRAHLRLSV